MFNVRMLLWFRKDLRYTVTSDMMPYNKVRLNSAIKGEEKQGKEKQAWGSKMEQAGAYQNVNTINLSEGFTDWLQAFQKNGISSARFSVC